MDEIDSGQGSFWEENRNLATGVILASAVAAGVIAYVLRRSREEEPVIEPPAGLADRAWEAARDAAGDERVDAAREFFMDHVMPELKPALLAILADLEVVVNEYFRRTEKSIKKL